MNNKGENPEPKDKFPVPPTPKERVSGPLPDPQKIAENIALGAFEVLSGYRSVRQLQRWLEPQLYVELAQRAGVRSRVKAKKSLPARVINSITCEPAEGVCEASVVVWNIDRPRGCAVRLAEHRGRWRAQALDVI